MKNGQYVLFFCWLMIVLQACKPIGGRTAQTEGAPRDWELSGFEKVDELNPILLPAAEPVFLCPVSGKEVHWEARNVLNPAAVVKDGRVHLFYRAQDASGTSRIGMAVSSDGLHFEKLPQPVFFPDNDSMKVYEWNYRKLQGLAPPDNCTNCLFDGVEDPRIVEDEKGTYYMTYTAYDGKTARLSIASSTDLLHWTKHGLVLRDAKYRDTWSKSGAIVTRHEGQRAVATRINGKYWMYFGDTDLFLAFSDDLLHWEVAESSDMQQRISVLHPRPGYFDSRLVEPGPFAMLIDQGIRLMYNARNAPEYNDPGLTPLAYAAGQALFDATQPWKLIDRTPTYFIHPDKEYERAGEVNEVCFVEGLVRFHNKWLLYYGTADSRIAVAVREL